MKDDPRRNLKWLEQELLAEDRIHRDFSRLPDPEYHKDEDLLARVDQLIGEEGPEPSVPGFVQRRNRATRGEQAARTVLRTEEPTALLTKTKQQLRQEEKQRKIAEKKANVNHNIKGLVFLAFLECFGILAILGWWLQ